MGHQSAVNLSGSKARTIEILNHLDGKFNNDIAKDIREGLTASQKYIPCKYFYDARGSKLFEDICQLPEYYPTRIELSILRKIAPTLARAFAHRDLVELGSGANLKIRTLLDATSERCRATMRYVPVDISESAIVEASRDLLERYPELEVLGVVADFTCQLDVLPTERPLMLCFLGSTIGNMGEDECMSFLQDISGIMKPDDTLLVGFDMVKPREVLESAYNDSKGVTAEFNRNVLNVVNVALNANFDLSNFDHVAFFSERESRIEVHLRANRNCSVRLESLDLEVEFREGETIHTENSRKFTRRGIEHLAKQAGLHIRDWYSDPDEWFSLVLMGLDTQENN